MRDFLEVHEMPIGYVGITKPEKIADRWGNVEACAFVQIWFGPLVPKNVLPMIGAKRTRVFPLCVRNAIAFADRHPVALACANG